MKQPYTHIVGGQPYISLFRSAMLGAGVVWLFRAPRVININSLSFLKYTANIQQSTEKSKKR